MKIEHLRTNHVENPIGFAMDPIYLSWITSDSAFKRQSSARIQVALDEDFDAIVYEEEAEDLDSMGVLLPIDLKPSTRYYWRVQVEAGGDWNQEKDAEYNAVDSKVTGSGFSGTERAESETAWFETAKDERCWKAKWIRSTLEEDPVLLCDFLVKSAVKQARLCVSGVGLYEVYLDGNKVGDEYLTPGFHDYDTWIQFQTYPVDAFLTEGNHRIEIVLGSGWYKGRHLSFWNGTPDQHYGDTAVAIAELSVTYEDGTTDLICTDEHWKSRKSRILLNSIYDGEIYDQGRDVSDLFPVKEAGLGYDRLKARLSVPVRKKLVLKPQQILYTEKGETVLDFGQNLAGWLVFYNRLPAGKTITCTMGEVLQEGCFYHGNFRTAKTEFQFRSDGKEGWIRPHFTWFGFRYAKIEGFDRVDPEDFEAWVLYSDLEQTGEITTGNTKINQLISNILWSQRGNFIDVPTDCPQRDERLGWTGDTQIFSMTAAYNMDVQAFFRKHMKDIYSEQCKHDGMVPMVVPDLFLTATSAAWGDVAVIVPWNMYQMYGEKKILEEQYPSMRDWVEFIYHQDEQTGGKRLWMAQSHFGDWLSLDAPVNRETGGTDVHLIASAYYYFDSVILAKASRVLGKRDEEVRYAKLAEEIRRAFLNYYYTGAGRLSEDTQTAYVLVLYMGLYKEEWKDELVHCLAKKLRETNDHLATGFVGTPYLNLVLSKFGRSDLAYTLLLQEDYPGWLYCVNMGATTIWERWNSIRPDGTMNPNGMNSLNHYAYGSIQEWMYKEMLGLQPKEDSPAWRRFVLAPKPDIRIGKASGSYLSPCGKIGSSWEFKTETEITFHFTVPFGAEAKLFLPDGRKETLSAGDYTFEAELPVKKRMLDRDSYLEDLLSDSAAEEILEKYFPGITARSFLEERKEMFLHRTLEQIAMEVFNEYTLIDLANAEKELALLG